MANLGNIGLFGNQEVTTLRNCCTIVDEAMENESNCKRLSKATIRKRLDAFEVVSAQIGLSPQQQKCYSELLKNC